MSILASGERFIAVDWGTSNRRSYTIEDGQVVDLQHGRGVTGVDRFEDEIAAMRAHHGDLPMVLAGMVGSSIGWREAAYAPAPAGLADLADRALRIDARTVIIPGISTVAQGRPDVMRGEEVQFLGAVAAGLAPPDALLIQPGTHSKWAELADGRLTGFTSSMTGELFALLRTHGVLAGQLQGQVAPGDAFLEGVREAARRDLSSSLFGIRAAAVLGLRHNDDAAAFASGLLIGSEIVARIADHSHPHLHILAAPDLGALYMAAIEAYGRAASIIDSQAAFVAGIIAIRSLL